MGTKLNPGKFDCYENAAPDEPMFVLLARDPLAPILVRLWADLRERDKGNSAKVFEARDCAIDMEKFRLSHAALSSPSVADSPTPGRIVQNWFCKLGMAKEKTHKRLNWDDCEHLLRLLSAPSASAAEEPKEKP